MVSRVLKKYVLRKSVYTEVTCYFLGVYRSPTISESSELNNEKLNELVKSIATKQYTHKFIVRDFNFNKINWTSWSAQSGENSVELFFMHLCPGTITIN